MRNRNWTFWTVAVAILMLTVICSAGSGTACALEAVSSDTTLKTEIQVAPQRYDLAIAISVSIGLSCLGAGYAVGKVGAAALGAASEKPELLTRGLLFVALAEGIAIYGLLIAVLLWIKL